MSTRACPISCKDMFEEDITKNYSRDISLQISPVACCGCVKVIGTPVMPPVMPICLQTLITKSLTLSRLRHLVTELAKLLGLLPFSR